MKGQTTVENCELIQLFQWNVWFRCSHIIVITNVQKERPTLNWKPTPQQSSIFRGEEKSNRICVAKTNRFVIHLVSVSLFMFYTLKLKYHWWQLFLIDSNRKLSTRHNLIVKVASKRDIVAAVVRLLSLMVQRGGIMEIIIFEENCNEFALWQIPISMNFQHIKVAKYICQCAEIYDVWTSHCCWRNVYSFGCIQSGFATFTVGGCTACIRNRRCKEADVSFELVTIVVSINRIY